MRNDEVVADFLPVPALRSKWRRVCNEWHAAQDAFEHLDRATAPADREKWVSEASIAADSRDADVTAMDIYDTQAVPRTSLRTLQGLDD